VIERAVITSSSDCINLDRALPVTDGGMKNSIEDIHMQSKERVMTHEELHELERNNILAALEKTGWRVSGEKGAAKLIGIPSTTLASRIKALGIVRPR
jgi:transcriptional regulator with GAF, ATPase, and Fis domain